VLVQDIGNGVSGHRQLVMVFTWPDVEVTTKGLDAGPVTIAWHLHAAGITVSPATIRRRLLAAGLIVAAPKERPRSSYVRFQADLPNECWQSDFTHWRLADGTDSEILTWLDDHARYALSITAHRHVTGPIVVATFQDTAAEQGFPASVLTDNALVYTTRFAGGRGGRNPLETVLAQAGITHKHFRPNHPPPAGRSNASSKPSNAGSPNSPPPTASPSSKPTWTASSTSTTIAAPTAP
jgi:hypothetical protein